MEQHVSLEEAFAEACRIIGEGIVRDSLAAKYAQPQQQEAAPGVDRDGAQQRPRPAPMPTWDTDGPTGETTA